MLDFTKYKVPGRTAIYTQVPIQYLETFRYFSAKLGNFYRIRYRGPRNTRFDYGRSYMTRQASCLKDAATSFSVYRY